MTAKLVNRVMLWTVRVTALIGPGLFLMDMWQPLGHDPCVERPEIGSIDLLIAILLALPYLHIPLRLAGTNFKRGLALAITTGLTGFAISAFFLFNGVDKEFTAAFMASQAALVAAAMASYYLAGHEAGDIRILAMGFVTFAIYLALFIAVPAFVLPLVKIPPRVSNQSSAVGSLRTLNNAEVTYSSTYTTGFSATLLALGPAADGATETASAAGLIDSSLASGKAGKYTLTYTVSRDAAGNITAYTTSARPIIDCRRPNFPSFFTDESGVIRGTDENRPATVHDPPLGG
jgi:type IV pilus assembly protein PilA